MKRVITSGSYSKPKHTYRFYGYITDKYSDREILPPFNDSNVLETEAVSEAKARSNFLYQIVVGMLKYDRSQIGNFKLVGKIKQLEEEPEYSRPVANPSHKQETSNSGEPEYEQLKLPFTY